MNSCFQSCIKSCAAAAGSPCPRLEKLLALPHAAVKLAEARKRGHLGPARPAPLPPQVARIEDIPTASTPLPQPNRVASSSHDGDGDGFVAPPPEEWAKHEQLMAGCEPCTRLRVAVLLSGGVDSSLALRLLRAAGHTCRAFYLQIWFQEDFRNFWDSCPWEEDLAYAQKVCDSLGVPLEVVPLTTEYWERVVQTSVDEIRAGRTPNPDMLCNSRVKFGAFYDYLANRHGSDFDRVASGHYARVVRAAVPPAASELLQRSAEAAGPSTPCGYSASSSAAGPSRHGSDVATVAAACSDQQQQEQGHSRHQERLESHAQASGSGPAAAAQQRQAAQVAGGVARLALTPDAVKDQTYFLAHLSPAQLAKVMFPLGALTKPQVRKLARAADLANKDRKDSQGICFLGKVKFTEFVKQHLGEWPGPIVEAESGRPVGLHQGYWFYTVGQRGGIKLPGGPWYVAGKDTLMNIVYVSRQYYDEDKRRDAFECGPFNWLGPDRPDPAKPLYCKVRHGPNMYRCTLELDNRQQQPSVAATAAAAAALAAASPASPAGLASGAGDGGGGLEEVVGRVVLEQDDQGLAAGQYAVFYQDDVCLGSAKIL